MSAYTERQQGSPVADFLSEHAQVLSIAFFFVGCVVFFSLATTTFLSAPNLLNVVRQAAPILVVAVAMTLVIVTAGIDLSVGSLVALINAVAAITLAAGWPWPAMLVAMLVLGGLIGLAQGWFVAYQGIPAFIVTLAGLSILRGYRAVPDRGLFDPDQGRRGFPLARSRRAVRYPGAGHRRAARRARGSRRHELDALRSTRRRGRVEPGSRPPRRHARARVPSRRSTSCPASPRPWRGCCFAARLGSGSSNAAVGFELQVIAAVVLGGTSLMGGRGSMIGTLLGTLTIAVIGNGLILIAHLAVLHADRHGRDHPAGDLAQHAHLHDALPLPVAVLACRRAVRDGYRGDGREGRRMSAAIGADENAATVMTVTGPVPARGLGVTLMHEHLLNDCGCWWNAPTDPARRALADAEVNVRILSELRQDPFVCRHNLALDDESLAIEELGALVGAGGRTVVDPTCRGIARNPAALVRIARATGLNIVMGAGYYLEASHPPILARMSADDVADEIVAEAERGVVDTGVRIGLIGEIGVSSDFTAAERKSLTGAARAQVRTGLPLMVHLPGWFRLGDAVLDLVETEGVDPHRVVLCHMNPSHMDTEYQVRLAARGAFVEYDMIGMDFYYADQQAPVPERRRGRARHRAARGRGTPRPRAALAGRVRQDDAGPLRRQRLRLRATPLPAAAAASRVRRCAARRAERRQPSPGVRPRPHFGDRIVTRRVLLVGESWVSSATHYKGFDQFGSVTFHTGAEPFVRALDGSDFEITWMKAHEAVEAFPFDAAGLDAYDAFVLSDIGANSLLLPPEVWLHSRTVPNRLKLLRERVERGAGLLMCGGYFSFQGIDGKARWRRTPVEAALPVTCLPWDDRVEMPEGTRAEIVSSDHPTVAGLDGTVAAAAGRERGGAARARRRAARRAAAGRPGRTPLARRRRARGRAHRGVDLGHRTALALARVLRLAGATRDCGATCWAG